MAGTSIGPLLGRWPYDPNGLCLRLVEGQDGRSKLQIRLDLGLLQIELEGRPDGQRPHGYASLLDYHLAQAEARRQRHGSAEGYELTAADCEALRAEAAQYYQRYFSLFHLQHFAEVERDTARNLTALDFIYRHSSTDADRWELEQFRPYLTMMNALARAERYVEELDYQTAERVLEVASAVIRAFAAANVGRFQVGREVDILNQRLKQLAHERPRSDHELWQRLLSEAVAREDYETAAELRDRLQRADAILPPFWE
ncbi:MAG: UvrB/UvrC motif-containing protein [Armatimonadetes bacterium]|nr:UvrB/UvrC motif-containing protein [Armatimonadota bacterium]